MKDKITIAVIGLGSRGLPMLKRAVLKMKDVEIAAVCDKYADRAEAGRKAVKAAKGYNPAVAADAADILARDDLDAVILFTSWESHLNLAVEFMKKGVYVATEVGGAYSLDECFDLVKAYRETKTPCMMLENCCYNSVELAALNAVRKGVFGEVVHCEGGYMHDLRSEVAFGKENRHYRLNNYLTRNCENYPTHEIGPISKILKINRGNRFVALTSTASNAAGMRDYVEANKKVDRELVGVKWAQGDVITTVLECENGETVSIFLDTTLPRFYSRRFTVRGTKAMYQEDGNIFFTDGRDYLHEIKQILNWNSGKKLVRKYKHPINKIKGKSIIHGSMDWSVLRAFVEAVKRGEDTPIDTCDTATWMAITALSDTSIKEKRRVDFPDFTGGEYKNRTDKLTNPYALD